MKTDYKTVLFNPFEKVAGIQALLIGLTAIILTGICAFWGNMTFDGIIDVHFVYDELPVIYHVTEGIVNWITLSILLFVIGLVFSKSKFRIIDVFGTQALARWPIVIPAILSMFVSHQKVNGFIEWKIFGKGEDVIVGAPEWVVFGIFMVLTISNVVWMIVLMYRAYSISCNIKGKTGIISFVAALLTAELASKFLLYYSLNIINS